ncbi:hypothetical protein GH714_026686 [Hevea brasiliensis]|nr:hypothetical protein GH714_026686 [Hevea brasiliensis]
MFHMHSPELKTQEISLGTPKCRLDRFMQLLENDNARRTMLSSHRLGQRRMMIQSPTAEIPLRSGASVGHGVFYVSFRIGSPHPQKFVLVADTASDLTWMNCKLLCKGCPEFNFSSGRVFQAKDSPSFQTIPCGGKTCQEDLVQSFALPDCPTPDTPCLYNYSYYGDRSASGVFANETVTVGLHGHHKIVLYHVLFGCTESSRLPPPFPDGVMGLGFSSISFAMRLADMFGNKFSYCLVDHLSPSNLNNYLSFGEPQHSKPQKMQYTELILHNSDVFYWVNVSGISVGDKMLNIPPETWNITNGGGAIIDSGTTLTLLAEAAYAAVMDAFIGTLTKFKKVEMPVTEFCFEATGFQESSVPNFVIHFADGAKLEPLVKSYIIDAADGIKCLGFQPPQKGDISIIGNIMQQGHYWEFDIGRSKLGFGPSSCILTNPKD